MSDQYILKTLSNAIDVLSVFETQDSLTAKEIASETHLNRTTLYRILYTLSHKGLLETDPKTGKYHLSMKFLHLSTLLLKRMDIKTIAHSHLRSLSDELNETVHLVVLSNDLAAFVDKFSANEDINMGSYIGWTAPLYSTASGKLLLSAKNNAWIDDYLDGILFKGYTSNTLANKEDVLRSIEMIRRRGYATDKEEIVEGLTCFAAPIKDHNERVIASVSVSGASSRIMKNKDNIIQRLMVSTQLISENIEKTPMGLV